jgi:hypothetical protein
MDSTGRYVARYEPSNSDHEYLQVAIEMSISDEATLPDMVNFFDSFLKAAGYVYEGSLKIVEPELKINCFNDFAFNSQGTDVISFR